MAVDIELFCISARSGVWGHEAVGHPVRINVGLVFIVSFEAADEGVKGFWTIFSDIEFNAGSIENEHVGKGSVDSLTDGFGEISHALEHQFYIRKKVLFEAGEKGSVRDFGKSAEIS